MKTMVGILVASMVLPTVGFAAISYSTGFEDPAFTVGSSIDGVDGWSDPANGSIVRDASYNTWGTHGKYLTCWGTNAFAYAPVLDTSAQPKVNIGVDFRPADGTTGGANPNGGGYIGLYGSGASNGITLIRFDSTGVDTGDIVATDGGNDHYITLGTWTFVDDNTSYHFDFTVDNVNRTTSVSIDGGPSTVLAWGGAFGSAVSSGTFERIWFRGGLNETRAMTAIDNLTIVPEPVTLALLIAGGLVIRRKRA